MSLADVIVGGAIGTAGTAVVSLASWRREARAQDRALRVQISHASLAAVILAQEAHADLVKAKHLTVWKAQMDESMATVVRAFEEILAVGSRASIDACEKILDGLFELGESMQNQMTGLEHATGVVQRARAQVLSPGRRGWWRRRRILLVFQHAPG